LPSDIERLLRKLYLRAHGKRLRLISDVNVLSTKKKDCPFLVRLRAAVASVKIWR